MPGGPSGPGGPPTGVHPTTSPPPGGPGRRKPLIIALVVVLVAALATGGFFLVRELTGEDAPPADPTGAPSPTLGPSTPADTQAPVPAGYTTVNDDLGFSVNVPENWVEAQHTGNSVYYAAPSGNASIRFVVDEPTDDTALGCFEDQTEQEDGPTDLPGYHELAMQEVEYAGHSAAEWEFTHLRDGPRYQVLWFAFLENDDVRWSFLLSAPQPLFDQFQPVLEEAKRSFDPTSA